MIRKTASASGRSQKIEAKSKKLIKSAYTHFDAVESQLSDLSKKQASATKVLSSRKCASADKQTLKTVHSKIAGTIRSIAALQSKTDDKLRVTYIAGIKTVSEQGQKTAHALVKGLETKYSELAKFKANFEILKRRVEAMYDDNAEEISDEVFLNVDDNGYIEEPQTAVDELEEFNQTFAGEDDAQELDGDEDQDGDGESTTASEDGDEDDLNGDSDPLDEDGFATSEDDDLGVSDPLDDDSVLDELDGYQTSEDEAIDEDDILAQPSATAKARAKLKQQASAKPKPKTANLSTKDFRRSQASGNSSYSNNDDSVLLKFFMQ